MNTEIVSGRANAMVDPVLHIWGWEIPLYLFLGGLAAGLLIVGAAFRIGGKAEVPLSRTLQVAPFLALGVLSVGMLALFLDLEHKWYVWRFYLAFRPAAPMSWGSWILILVYPAGFLLGMGALDTAVRNQVLACRLIRMLRLTAWAKRTFETADRLAKPIAWSAVVLGASLGIYTGILLGTLSAVPLWNSPALGPLFLTSGISTGAALLLLLPLRVQERHAIVRWDIRVIALELVLLALFLIGMASGGGAGQNALYLLTSGPQASAFWTVVVLGGLMVPLILEVLESRRGLPTLFAGPVLVLAGGFALRWVLVVAGQASSLATSF